VKIVKTITINRSPDETFAFWRQLENLPRFMRHVLSVKVLGSKTSLWVAKAPAGRTVAWEAEIIDEQPSALLAWRSRDGADIQNGGTVRFNRAPAGRGTEVTVLLEFIAPAGVLGQAIAKLFGEDPSQQLEEDLRRFKSVMETGELPTSASLRPGSN
jgi:uncharacterized membrane protein